MACRNRRLDSPTDSGLAVGRQDVLDIATSCISRDFPDSGPASAIVWFLVIDGNKFVCGTIDGELRTSGATRSVGLTLRTRPGWRRLMAEMGQIPSNMHHQEGQHRADSGAPPAWAWPAR
jgi:hypothetical protein